MDHVSKKWSLPQRHIFEYSCALLAVAVAYLVQVVLDPFVGAQFPYVTFFLAGIFTAWMTSLGPGVFTLVTGYLVAAFVFLEPSFPLAIFGRDNLIGATVYASVGLTVISLIERQRALSDELRMANYQLHRTVEELNEAAIPRRELAAIVEHSDDAIISKELDGTITSWNRSAERIYGYSSDDAIGRNIAMLFPPDRAEESRLLLDRVRRGETIQQHQTSRLRRDGVLVDVSVTISPIKNDEGAITGGSAISRDITELNRVARILRKRNRQLAESDRRKDEFLAMLAHELRNPLGAILTANEVLAHHGQPAARAHTLHVIHRQVGHMARLLDDLLDVARITRRKIELRQARIDVRSVVERALETCGPTLESHGHELSVSLPSEELELFADADRVEQILVNLLDNAAKYTNTPGHIWLSAQRMDQDIVLSVADNGIGIASDALPTVFDLFTQSTSSLDRSEGGLGLGLALVRGLTKLHGGSVEVHSDGPGCGAEFTVRLPAWARATDDDPLQFADPMQNMASANSAVCQHHAARILVVDDNEDVLVMMRQLLEMEGHEVHIATDGTTALTMARSIDPDVILLDIGLPDVDGYEVAKRLSRRPEFRHTVLVALTGYGSEEDMQRSRDAGFDHHLVKPIDMSELRRLLTGRRERTELNQGVRPA